MNLHGPHRILIIDDNREIHADFRKILCPGDAAEVDRSEASFFGSEIPAERPEMFVVESAYSGEEGIALLKRAIAEDRPPAVAIVDVRMPPGLDGIETAKQLWQLSPDLQLVICTAYSDYSWEEMIAKLEKRDRLLVLKKPFAAIEALQIACALSEKWVLSQRARRHLDEVERVVAERTWKLLAANAQLAAEIEQRKQAERHLLRTQRLDSIGTLASGIAHHLNNMLNPIVLSAQLLRNDWPAARREEFLSTIETGALRAAGIIRQVLTFAEGIDGESVLLEPKHFVREIEEIVAGTFPNGIATELRMDDDLWLIEGDPTQLRQVLINLCVNARDAMSEGGTLKIAVANSETDANCPGATTGRYVRVSVSDTGCGIPEAVIDRIFDPFFSTKPIGKGTGLGLSTVAGIVKGHGGFITVRSEAGAGALFEIFLPAAIENAAKSGAEMEGELASL